MRLTRSSLCRPNIRCGAATPRRRLLPTVRELGIAYVAYSPLGRGFLTGQFRSPADFPDDDYRRFHPRFTGGNFEKNIALVQEIEAMAAEKGCTAAQLAMPGCWRRGRTWFRSRAPSGANIWSRISARSTSAFRRTSWSGSTASSARRGLGAALSRSGNGDDQPLASSQRRLGPQRVRSAVALLPLGPQPWLGRRRATKKGRPSDGPFPAYRTKLSASRTGSCGGPWPCRTSCARRLADRG